MSVLAVVLIACAVVLILAAEWPRLSGRVGIEGRERRQRTRRKAKLRVIEGDSDDFAASVQRDLERLPVIEERDDRRR